MRLGEATTSGYRLINVPTPSHRLIHVHPGIEELGTVYQADLKINSGPNRLADCTKHINEPTNICWAEWREKLRENYLEWSNPHSHPGVLQLGEIVYSMHKLLPKDTIVTNGAGNYTSWLHRHHRFCFGKSQLAPTSGSMGYGLPAAIAAKLLYPQRVVVAFAGDGCFLMTSQELATAVKYNLPLIIVLVNNAMYGTIRMHQERRYPRRISGTDLVNPDFCKLAVSFGACAERIKETKDFLPALKRAEVSERPSLIELMLDPNAISASQTLTGIQMSADDNETNPEGNNID